MIMFQQKMKSYIYWFMSCELWNKRKPARKEIVMAKIDYEKLAAEIIGKVGGTENISHSISLCYEA